MAKDIDIAAFLKQDEKITKKNKQDALVQYVVEKFIYAREELAPFHELWKEHFINYKGTRSDRKEEWQSNYTCSTLKEITRVKVPLYMNILFSKGLDSFDMKAGELNDEDRAPIVKDVIKYQLRNIGKKVGGFYGTWGNYCKQFEMYGYTAGMVCWKKELDLRGRTTFDGPDFKVLDIFHFFPDPSKIGIDSWKVIQYKDIYVSYLRMQEEAGIYKNVIDLRDTGGQPDDNVVSLPMNPVRDVTRELDKRVELLEYHGSVPKSLLSGKLTDLSDIDEYEDEYVDAIVTIANRKIVIRADKYPYDCGNIFVESCKDRMLTERFGIGTGEDIEAMAEELTNAHNKFSDSVNIISNPMGIVNPNGISGLSGTLITHPGKMFVANSMVDDVRKAIQFIDTTAAAAALTPLMNFIEMIDQRIMKLSQAVPAISPVTQPGDLPETLGGTQIQQANAAEPIKHIVKHELEPAWEEVLGLIYKLDIQLFPDSMAYRLLGKDGMEIWSRIKEGADKITREDLTLAGDPDFIPRGVTVFAENQVELRNLLEFLQIIIKSLIPKLDDNGQQVPGPDGQPQQEPAGDVAELLKRIAMRMNLEDIDLILPGLKALRERQKSSKKLNKERAEQEKEIRARAGVPTPEGGAASPGVPPTGSLPMGGGNSTIPAGTPNAITPNAMQGTQGPNMIRM